MKFLSILSVGSVLLLLINCKKGQLDETDNSNLFTAKVLTATCSIQSGSTEVAVQLNTQSDLATDFKKPGTDSIFHNVVFTFNGQLRNSIGKTFTYQVLRKPNTSDTTTMTTIAVCFSYPLTVFENVKIN